MQTRQNYNFQRFFLCFALYFPPTPAVRGGSLRKIHVGRAESRRLYDSATTATTALDRAAVDWLLSPG
jgi:hypothetical protein